MTSSKLSGSRFTTKFGAAVLTGVTGTAAFAALAVPALRHHHVNVRVRTIALPVDIQAWAKQAPDAVVGDDTPQLLAGSFPASGPWHSPIGATYGPAGVSEFFVGAAQLTRSLTPTEVATFELPGMTALTPISSGPFGGTVRCAEPLGDQQKIVSCVLIDSSAVIVVDTFDPSESHGAALTRQVASAVER